MRVNFNLRATKPSDKPQPINAVIRWNAQRLVYSTSCKVRPKHWNDDRQRVKAIEEPKKGFINNFLAQFENLVAEFAADQKAKLKTVHVEDLKAYLDSLFAPKTKSVLSDTDRTLFVYIDNFIKKRKEHPKLSKSVGKFCQLQAHLKGFAAQNSRLIDFEQIDLAFFDDFLKYLFSRKLKQNTCQKMIATLKTVLNDATEHGFNSFQAYKSRKFNTPTENVQNVYLSTDELTELLNFDLTDNPRLERVRDLFLIGTWTGLRFSDFTNIKPENITKKNQLVINTIKTGQDVVIPLHPVVKSMLDKYNGKIPKSLSNQKMNDYLKELCKLVGFDSGVIITSTYGGKRIDKSFEKWQLITTHTARRSFATNAFKSGIPALQIMKITGHTTDSSFKKYIKVSNEENADLLSENPFFKGEYK